MNWASRHGPCRGSWPATGCPGWPSVTPMTGEVIRASRATTRRYEKTRPGELVHMDVKKLGRSPTAAAGAPAANHAQPPVPGQQHQAGLRLRSLTDRRLSGWPTPRSCPTTTPGPTSGRCGRSAPDRCSSSPTAPGRTARSVKTGLGAALARSDPGQGVTTVSCVRFVGRCWCSAVAHRPDGTDLMAGYS